MPRKVKHSRRKKKTVQIYRSKRPHKKKLSLKRKKKHKKSIRKIKRNITGGANILGRCLQSCQSRQFIDDSPVDALTEGGDWRTEMVEPETDEPPRARKFKVRSAGAEPGASSFAKSLAASEEEALLSPGDGGVGSGEDGDAAARHKPQSRAPRRQRQRQDSVAGRAAAPPPLDEIPKWWPAKHKDTIIFPVEVEYVRRTNKDHIEAEVIYSKGGEEKRIIVSIPTAPLWKKSESGKKIAQMKITVRGTGQELQGTANINTEKMG